MFLFLQMLFNFARRVKQFDVLYNLKMAKFNIQSISRNLQWYAAIYPNGRLRSDFKAQANSRFEIA